MKSLLAATLPVLLLTSARLPAQETTLPAPIRISLVAIGDAPQPRFEIRGDGRHFIENPTSDYPPGVLFLKEKTSKGEEFKELTLGLNTPTGYVAYQGESTLNLLRADKGGAKTPYAALPIPKLDADMTILLTRDRKKDSWDAAPVPKFLNNSMAAFPPDSARFLNLSAVPIRILAGTEKLFELSPGAERIIRLKRSEQGVLSYRIAASVDGKIFPLTDTATTYTPDARINLVAYNADGTDRTQPVKVIRFFERPPEVPVKKG